MKLKRLPEDFQVDELADVPTIGGPFALYRLTKRSQGTPEAIDEILRRWKLPRQRVSYGGLKDRHALTTQYVTIKHGPPRTLREKSLTLEHLGFVPRPFEPKDIAGNRFHIVMRDLTEPEMQQALTALDEARVDGIPNYFDDQRFGSVGFSGEFVARPWCLGDYERTLWLALADANPHDRPDEREQKRILRDQWGDWKACKAALERSHRRSIVTYLVDKPTDFRGAVARLRVDLRSLYLAAFQSSLWNRVLAAWVRQVCRPDQLTDVDLKLGSIPFFGALVAEQRQQLHELELPLPSARLKLEPGPVADVVERVLAESGLELRQVRVKYPRDSFFSKGWRTAIVVPRGISHELAGDELYAGRQKLTLGFDLPRGAYATMLVKRLTAIGEHSH